ncbi:MULTISPECIES: NmrA family transcriptional regulator [unclassified Streptomyces]|uniref:NmrA family transcriptional regulator n=1 Tax=unclassified Streptomyces TaxID=2593676 RepID=UPI003645675F
MQRHTPVLVLGGTGKTGRRVVQRLAARHLPVRIGSRSGGLPFDWQKPATWEPALADVRAAYVTYQPDLAAPGAPETVGRFARLAAASGVRRLVLLSGRGEPDAARAEEALQQCGVEWTVVRSAWFNQNFSEDHLREAVVGGRIALPAGRVAEPFVDADDIADVATAALTEDGHAARLYEVTGPRLLTFADVAAQLGSAIGRRIEYVPLTPAEYAATLARAHVPKDVADLLGYLFTTVLDGRGAHLAEGVQQALGRAPRDFADYARSTAATGIWNERQPA